MAANEGYRRARSSRPLGREARPSLVAGTYGVLLSGLILLAAALAGDPSGGAIAAHVIVGLAVVVAGAAAIVELLPLRALGWLGLAAGVALAASALLVDPIEAVEVGRLAAGAVLFMSGAGILAASRSV